MLFKSCQTLHNSMNCSRPGFPVLHYLPEFAQTHVHWVSDAMQPFHPVSPFFSCPQSFLALGSFPMNQFFTLGVQNIGDSGLASVLPMKIQGWFPLGLTSLISWLSKELSRVFSNTTIWKHPKKEKKIKYLLNYKTKIESYKNQYKCNTGIGFVFIGGFFTYILDLFWLVWNILCCFYKISQKQ